MHDRTTLDVPKHAQAAVSVIPDPMEKGAGLVVTVNTRFDVLRQMERDGRINSAEFLAGRRFEEFWHNAQLSIRAIDTTRDPVDGGKYPDPLPESKAYALMGLNAAHEKLGTEWYILVRRVLIDGEKLTELGNTDRISRRLRDDFKICLGLLAQLWGYATSIRGQYVDKCTMGRV